MYHGAHRFRVYHTRRHFLVSSGLIALSIVVLFAAGYFVNAPWNVIASAIGISIWRVLIGYGISLFLGTLLALLVGASPWGERLLPFFDVLQNVPSFALIPIFILAFGYGSTMIILFAATSILWPIMFYAASAILGAREELSDAATVFGARGWKRLVYYFIPLSFPALVTGSIVGISIGWEAVIGAEIIVNARGIGSFLNSAGAAGNEKLVAIGIVALLLIVFIVSRVVWVPLLKSAKRYSEV
ncbi:ABC transporter permease subunit [Candidatus Kaiserbacteria bacterium]|nr:ABC transporter permease subunit [Candidatus Kaiserbacteria bacterium]